MPGTQGNQNAATHGVYGFLTTGRMPKSASYVKRQLGVFRRSLEQITTAKYGEITLSKAALISSAIRHEGRFQLLARWLSKVDEASPLKDRLELLRAMGDATEARDRALRSLGINGEPADAATAFYDRLRSARAAQTNWDGQR